MSQCYALYKCRKCGETYRRPVHIHQREEPEQFLPILMQNNGGVDYHLCLPPLLGPHTVGVSDLIGGIKE